MTLSANTKKRDQIHWKQSPNKRGNKKSSRKSEEVEVDAEEHKIRARDLAHRLQRAFAENAEVLGPHEEDEDERITTVSSAVLQEWVLILSWADAEDSGTTYTTRLSAPGMPQHHETGLLHEVLYDFD